MSKFVQQDERLDTGNTCSCENRRCPLLLLGDEALTAGTDDRGNDRRLGHPTRRHIYRMHGLQTLTT